MNLQEMLTDGVKYAPRYKPASNSDHLPMTLAAMSGLGATNPVLEEFRLRYARRLHEWDTGADEIRLTRWQDGIGQYESWPALMACFRGRIEAEGLGPVLNETLDVLLPAVAIDAFHPIIRLGYAVDFDSPDEAAAALAYMAATYREVPVSGEQIDLRAALEQQVETVGMQLGPSRFGDAISGLVETGRYPVGAATGLEELANVALDLYLATRNFFALHLVTATQAIRCSVPEPLLGTAIQSMTGAMLASHLVLGSPAINGDSSVPLQLDPEHACKYVWACLSEYRCYGDSRYLEEIRTFKQAGLVPDWVTIQ